MAVRPLRPATDRCFGGPLPRQLANRTRVHPVPPKIFTLMDAHPCAHAVLPAVSSRYPPVRGRFPTRYSPVRHYAFKSCRSKKICTVRLACVKHAASVYPEPGSNSHVKFHKHSGFEPSCIISYMMMRFLSRRPVVITGYLLIYFLDSLGIDQGSLIRFED